MFLALHKMKSENDKTRNRVKLSCNIKILYNMRQFTVDSECLLRCFHVVSMTTCSSYEFTQMPALLCSKTRHLKNKGET
jgi:hypothetical protein